MENTCFRGNWEFSVSWSTLKILGKALFSLFPHVESSELRLDFSCVTSGADDPIYLIQYPHSSIAMVLGHDGFYWLAV